MEEQSVAAQTSDYTTLAWYKTVGTVFSTVEYHFESGK